MKQKEKKQPKVAMKRYDHSTIELKWQSKWQKDKNYHPDLESAKHPFYNLMMFPYPSAEGLHIGGVRTFVGVDIYARFKRARGYDVFMPFGLDGFGIHAENYALKIGQNPMTHAQVTEKNFYRQIKESAISVDWERIVETYKPEYYKWTQWLFVELFKAGLAYRKKSPVNFCPSCKTVLADEQVIDGKCERCGSIVEKKNLEQWFFRITNYADRLLANIDGLNWTEKVKIAQRNWIGKSDGVELEFPLKETDVKRIILLHGKGGSPERDFFPWLKKRLEGLGYEVQVPSLPNSTEPNDDEQADYVQKNCKLDEQTAIVGHSFGAIVALRLLERGIKVKRVVLVSMPFSGKYLDGKERPSVTAALKKGFDFVEIKKNAGFIALYDRNDHVVPVSDGEAVAKELDCYLMRGQSQKSHFNASEEPDVLTVAIPAIRVFTTRPDTLYGATFLVLSPEHPWVQLAADDKHKILENKEEVRAYIDQAKKKDDLERSENKDKTGVQLKGVKAINPLTHEEIPMFVADYVLMGYGTGAIMAVPAHDQRDLEFAKKFDLPIKQVIAHFGKGLDEAYTGPGKLFNSGNWDGINVPEQMDRVIDSLEKEGIGKRVTTYHLRDWLISRQRYWGPPIPMIYCETCAKEGKGQQNDMPGWYSVPEKDLPVELPYIEDFKPLGTGKSPLGNHPEFYEVKCPNCGSDARRETDVSDTFLDSSWYFFAYLGKENSKFEIRNSKFRQRAKRWLPVHMYIGGAEHSVLHLLYARFVTMFLKDTGLITFEEPFSRFYAHGLIIKDGAKMSKSKGNVVGPDVYIKKFGADTLRMYLHFLSPYNQDGDFRDSGIEGMNRFLKRIWILLSKFEIRNSKFEIPAERLRAMHQAIKGVTDDMENLRYNTAIAKLMEYYNFLAHSAGSGQVISKDEAEVYIKLLAPFAPHMAEELFEALGNSTSIHTQKWPEFDEKYLVSSTVKIAVQVNGKLRGILEVGTKDVSNQEKIKELAQNDPKVSKFIGENKIKQVIYITGKVVNIVVE